MAQPDPAGRSARFLAREREMETLRHQLEAAAGGDGGLLLVAGEPGIGRTSLARRAAEQAEQSGFTVVWGTCLEGTLGRPFGGLADALERHALKLPAATVVADLGTDVGPIVRICPALAALVPNFTPAVPLEPADERLRLHEALFGWLSRMARRGPLLLVIDDVHNGGTDLVAALAHLAARLRDVPVLVLATQTLVGELEPVAVDVIRLGGLDVGATGALLAEISVTPVAPTTIELVQSVTGGSPLFSIELYRHLVEDELIPGVRGGNLPAVDQLPQTLAQVIAWRVARLSPETRASLNVLAAFPEGAAAQVVAAAAGLTRPRAVEALEPAIAHGLATVHNSDGDHWGDHWVDQPAVRDALLGALPAPLRAQLHRRVAEALESHAPGGSRADAGALAYHYAASSTLPGHERGVQPCLLATEQARAAYAYARATECLRWALSLTAESDVRAQVDLRARLATTESAAGLRDAALATSSRLLETSGAAANVALGGVLDTLRGLRGTGVGIDQWAELDSLRVGVLNRSSRADAIEMARLQLLAERWEEVSAGGVRVLIWSGLQPDAAKRLWDSGAETDREEVLLVQRPRNRVETGAALELSRSARRPQTILRALHSGVSDLALRHGLFNEAAAWAAQYLATAERFGSRRDQVRALLLSAVSQAPLGAFGDATSAVERAELILRPIPDAESLARELLLARLAHAYFLDGDWTAFAEAVPDADVPLPASLLFGAYLTLAHVRLGNEARHASSSRSSSTRALRSRP